MSRAGPDFDVTYLTIAPSSSFGHTYRAPSDECAPPPAQDDDGRFTCLLTCGAGLG